MSNRKRIKDSDQTNILIQSRRRCCICFGLNRDGDIKRGQIAHLDKNPNNNNADNLVYLCFEHHDEYDGKTSQSKGFTIKEIKKYREELYIHFGPWNLRSSDNEHLLNFLADTTDLETIASAVIKIANNISLWGKDYAYQALTWKIFESCDGDIYAPFLVILDYFVSWGLLTYEIEEVEMENGLIVIDAKIFHKPICKEIAKIIKDREIK